MSDTSPTPEERKRITDSIIAKAFPQKNTISDDERIIGRAVAATRRIRDQFAPTIAAYGFPDKKQHGLAIGRAFLEEFSEWDKADLVYLCSVIHMDSLLEKMR